MNLEIGYSQWLTQTQGFAFNVSEIGRESAVAAMRAVAQWIPLLSENPVLLFQLCTLCLAAVVWWLCRRVWRVRAAMRGIAAELEQHRVQLADFQQRYSDMAQHLARLSGDTSDLAGRQRSIEACLGRPDPKLAAAMARSGVERQHMVDCGLSHGEIHLLQALNSAGTAPARAAAG